MSTEKSSYARKKEQAAKNREKISYNAKKERLAMTAKELAFCHEFVIYGNVKQSAIRAGYSPKTAHVQATNLLHRPKIQNKIHELREELVQKSKKTAEDVRRELERVAFSNVRDIVDWNESGMAFLHNSKDIPREKSAAIETLQATEEAVGAQNAEQARSVLKTKVKLHNKIKALELLGKDRGMFRDQIELSGEIDIRWQQES